MSHQFLFGCYKMGSSPVAGAMSYVASTTSKFDIATSLGETLPSGLANGDGLFGFLMTRSNATIPAGWTEITHVDCANSAVAMQRLTLVKKNSVSSSDSGTSVSFGQVSSGRIGLTLIAVRSTSALFTIAEFSSSHLDGVTTYIITPPSLTATADNEIFVIGGTTVLASTDTLTASTLPGFSTSSFSASGLRVNGQYGVVNSGYTNSGDFNMQPTASLSEGGLATIIFRVQAT